MTTIVRAGYEPQEEEGAAAHEQEPQQGEDTRERRRELREQHRRRALAEAKSAGGCRLMRLPEVEVKTSLRKSAIYQGVAEGTFPAPVHTGRRTTAWVEAEVQEWINARIKARDAGTDARTLPLDRWRQRECGHCDAR